MRRARANKEKILTHTVFIHFKYKLAACIYMTQRKRKAIEKRHIILYQPNYTY